MRTKITLLTIITLSQFGYIALVGCPSPMHNAQQRLKESQSKAREAANKHLDPATKYEKIFYDCMSNYAQNNFMVNATASEIAEAGLSECQRPLEQYSYHIHIYFDFMATSQSTSLRELDHYQRIAQENEEKNIDKVMKSGKRKAISKVIENRKHETTQ